MAMLPAPAGPYRLLFKARFLVRECRVTSARQQHIDSDSGLHGDLRAGPPGRAQFEKLNLAVGERGCWQWRPIPGGSFVDHDDALVAPG
jgi:hypothetical protein